MTAAKARGSRKIQAGCARLERAFPGVFLPLDRAELSGDWRCLVLCPGHPADVSRWPWIFISEAWLVEQTDGVG